MDFRHSELVSESLYYNSVDSELKAAEGYQVQHDNVHEQHELATNCVFLYYEAIGLRD